jgi:2-polyprenyl-3-methyl-5-hydroxy-6-metoxy-1,4-benzoquinol methylase
MYRTTMETDRSREMDETSWWDLWNTSYRVDHDHDAVANELFARTSAVVNEISRAGASRILEIACGTGSFSRSLMFSSYYGLDISPAAIDIARHNSEHFSWPGNVSSTIYEAADFHDWPLRPEPFDLVICVDAVSSFRDQRLALEKMAQSLRPSGSLVLTTINPFVYNRIRRTRPNMLQCGPVSHWLTRGELHNLIESAGLTIKYSGTIMPRGHGGILRLVNSPRVNGAFGPRMLPVLKRLKERVGLGQYRLVIARKDRRA